MFAESIICFSGVKARLPSGVLELIKLLRVMHGTEWVCVGAAHLQNQF